MTYLRRETPNLKNYACQSPSLTKQSLTRSVQRQKNQLREAVNAPMIINIKLQPLLELVLKETKRQL